MTQQEQQLIQSLQEDVKKSKEQKDEAMKVLAEQHRNSIEERKAITNAFVRQFKEKEQEESLKLEMDKLKHQERLQKHDALKDAIEGN